MITKFQLYSTKLNSFVENKIFERKGNYQLFHKTQSLEAIIDCGYIIAGGNDEEDGKEWWNTPLRKNVFPNMGEEGPKTISATRNLNYLWLPALELDVEKISDKYKIIPYSENPDFYLDFQRKFQPPKELQKNFQRNPNYKQNGQGLKPASNKNLHPLQNMLRSKSKKAGELYWRVKTDKMALDFGIAEELIVTDKLDVGKYVKRIIYDNENKRLIDKIKEKYPHIEIVKVDKHRGYSDIKKAIKQKERQKELVYQESFDYEDDPFITSAQDSYGQTVIGYGKVIRVPGIHPLDVVEPTLRGLIRDNIDFEFYYSEYSEHTEYLIILRGDWKSKLEKDDGGNLLPSTEGDQWYISPIRGTNFYHVGWIKIDDVEIWLDAKRYNL